MHHTLTPWWYMVIGLVTVEDNSDMSHDGTVFVEQQKKTE